MPKKTVTTAVIYARFSPRRNAGECESIETQQEYCNNYCNFHKLEVVAEFDDQGLSGATDNRPGLREALGLACAERAVLVVYSLSRLSRSTRDAIRISEQLQEARADLCSVTEKIDTTSAYGKFFFVLMAAMGELERQQVAERTSSAMRRHQATGRRMSAVLPFGWQRDTEDPSRMVPDEDELAAIALMQQCRESGCGYREIAAEMTLSMYESRAGTWYGSSIRRILNRVEAESA